MFCCRPSLATPSVGTTPKCCKRLLKLFSCCCGGISDGQDGHNNGHDIHLKCVVTCCSGTVADNDIADRTKREEGYAEPEQNIKQRKPITKNKREKTVRKNRFMGLSKKSNDLKTTAEEAELYK